MNIGLVVGQVRNPDYSKAAGAYVRLMRVRTGMAQIAISRASGSGKEVDARCDASGKFTIPFGWSGAAFAEDIMSAQLDLVSWRDRAGTGHAVASVPMTIGAVIRPNIVGMLGLPQFETMPDLLNFANDLIAGYRKLTTLPLWSVARLTTENYLMLSGVELVLRT